MLNENGLHSPLKARNLSDSVIKLLCVYVYIWFKKKNQKLDHICTRSRVQEHSAQLLTGNLHVHPKKNG